MWAKGRNTFRIIKPLEQQHIVAGLIVDEVPDMPGVVKDVVRLRDPVGPHIVCRHKIRRFIDRACIAETKRPVFDSCSTERSPHLDDLNSPLIPDSICYCFFARPAKDGLNRLVRPPRRVVTMNTLD